MRAAQSIQHEASLATTYASRLHLSLAVTPAQPSPVKGEGNWHENDPR